MTSGIYAIVCVVSGHRYVGSAINFNGRWRDHIYRLRHGKHHSIALQRAWNKHGADKFSFEIVEVVANRNLLVSREQFWIDQFDSYRAGYNTRPTASSQLGLRHSAETREKIRVAKTGMKYGPHSAETREKIAAAQRGRKFNPDHLERLRISLRGRKMPPLSDEHKRKIGAANAAWEHESLSTETKEKISAALRGRRHSMEAIAKMSVAKRGRPSGMLGKRHSEETKRKMAEARRRYYVERRT